MRIGRTYSTLSHYRSATNDTVNCKYAAGSVTGASCRQEITGNTNGTMVFDDQAANVILFLLNIFCYCDAITHRSIYRDRAAFLIYRTK